VTGPPAARPNIRPSIRLDEKQGRASRVAKRVRIVSDYGVADTCTDDDPRLRLYIEARNAERVRNHRGDLVAIRLHSTASDYGCVGENWGDSNVTTHKERLGCGPLLQHKPSARYLSPRHAQ